MTRKPGSARPLEDAPVLLSKVVPGSCDRKLASAERRLLGAIARDEPRARLIADAERVRRAQLGVIKARVRVAELPTEIDDDQAAQARANLDADGRAWSELTADEIVARYVDAASRASRQPP